MYPFYYWTLIDNDWNVQEVVLDFCELTGDHKWREHGEVINCLQEYNIEKQFISITADNASNNKKWLKSVLW